LAGNSIANLKELRPPSSGRTEIRILLVFDPWRSAVLLVAGDKFGQWDKWYRTARTRYPPMCLATCLLRRPPRAALNWMFFIRSPTQPTGRQRPDLAMWVRHAGAPWVRDGLAALDK
jgi:hypothetical protein